ncbi:DUF4867 domain-containing protein [Virgibacillus indicus]|uniref:DUF4867 domain-containing protein n=1 Tax=Virgibacillus indicus TaxID=2024554 RepID=A0A265N843_9BACI|nr:DUF4867 family protein [Virgibacillus indicus]OZU88200.1 DUF4867 domain-containing protein [Virgibacillus indicus]
MLEAMRSVNEHISLLEVADKEFSKYGKVLKGFDVHELTDYMNKIDIPQNGNVYIASEENMESYPVKEILEKHVYGGMNIQIGYCNGKNSHLNGLEYHKGSEINIAITDLILILGSVTDIENNTYDTSKVEVFYLPAGTAVEMYQTTLHFSPCKVNEAGFKCIVILPAGTNEPLTYRVNRIDEEDDLLFMRNKWLICHPDRKQLVENGAYPGLTGENVHVNYLEKGEIE